MKENHIEETLSKYNILLAPSFTQAAEIKAEATVEAEYGKECVEGTIVTLAHHGPRNMNPAPCNTNVDILPEGSTILMSHIDLDAVGGVMALVGIKPEDDKFWKAAGFIDVNGPQHTWELEKSEQDKLNAIWAWNKNLPRSPRLTEVTDVSHTIADYAKTLSVLLGERTLEQDRMIENGRTWVEETTKDVESCLVKENESVRVFQTHENGTPFCCGSYYSENLGKPSKAAIQFNPKMNAITLSFYDGGKEASAEKIMQSVFGPLAGGRAGIAGTPRGDDAPKLTLNHALILSEYVEEKLTEITKNKNGITEDKSAEICEAATKPSKWGRGCVKGTNKIDITRKNTPPEISAEAVKRDNTALKYENNRIPEICAAAVKPNEWGRKCIEGTNKIDTTRRSTAVNNMEETPEISAEAVKRDDTALKHINNQTPEI